MQCRPALKRPLNGHLKLAINRCIVVSIGRLDLARFAVAIASVLHMTKFV